MSLGGPSRHISRAICSSMTLLLTLKFVYVCSCAHDWNPGIMVRFPHRISSIVLNQPRMWNKQVRGVLLVCLTVVGCRIWKRLKFHGRTLDRTALHSLEQFSSKGVTKQGSKPWIAILQTAVFSKWLKLIFQILVYLKILSGLIRIWFVCTRKTLLFPDRLSPTKCVSGGPGAKPPRKFWHFDPTN